MPVAGERGGVSTSWGQCHPASGDGSRGRWRCWRDGANVLDALNGARQTLRTVPVCCVCSPTMQNTF